MLFVAKKRKIRRKTSFVPSVESGKAEREVSEIVCIFAPSE